MKDVRIHKAGQGCAICGAPLLDVSRHPSILQWMEHEDAADQETPESIDAPSRIDICPECWGKDHALDYFCYWLARRRPASEPVKKDKKTRNAFLKELFYHYYNGESAEATSLQNDADQSPDQEGEEKSPEDEARERNLHIYLLAHLLMRFKVFQWTGERNDDGETQWLVFEDPAAGQSLQVPDLDPNSPDLSIVHKELMTLLEEQQQE